MKAAITRLAVLVLLLVNQTLVTIGWEPLPYSEEDIYEGVSSVATVAMAIYTWWKNNSVTEEAKEADVQLKRKKQAKKDR